MSHTYPTGKIVRVSGRTYKVINPSVTVDGESGLVLLGAVSGTRGGAAGQGTLLALHPDEIAESEVVPTTARRPPFRGERNLKRGKASRPPVPLAEGQSPVEGGTTAKPVKEELGLRGLRVGWLDALAITIYAVVVLVIVAIVG